MSPTRPSGAENRGFAIYVNIQDAAVPDREIDLDQLASRLQEQITATVPNASISTSVTGQDRVPPRENRQPAPGRRGVVIDISRQRVTVDGYAARITFREFKLLSCLIHHEGTTVSRGELSAAENGSGPQVSLRTVDVHIKRLRMKLEPYRDIVRTERGSGYRFDRHADVRILNGSGD